MPTQVTDISVVNIVLGELFKDLFNNYAIDKKINKRANRIPKIFYCFVQKEDTLNKDNISNQTIDKDINSEK